MKLIRTKYRIRTLNRGFLLILKHTMWIRWVSNNIYLWGGFNMRKVMIGSVIMFSGVITTVSLIIAAALYASNINSWQGTKLWYNL